jgi:hypothetical protein
MAADAATMPHWRPKQPMMPSPVCSFSGAPVCPFPHHRAGSPCTFTERDFCATVCEEHRSFAACGAGEPRPDKKGEVAPLGWPKFLLLTYGRGADNEGTFAFDARSGQIVASWRPTDGGNECKGPSGFAVLDLTSCRGAGCYCDDRPY